MAPFLFAGVRSPPKNSGRRRNTPAPRVWERGLRGVRRWRGRAKVSVSQSIRACEWREKRGPARRSLRDSETFYVLGAVAGTYHCQFVRPTPLIYRYQQRQVKSRRFNSSNGCHTNGFHGLVCGAVAGTNVCCGRRGLAARSRTVTACSVGYKCRLFRKFCTSNIQPPRASSATLIASPNASTARSAHASASSATALRASALVRAIVAACSHPACASPTACR